MALRMAHLWKKIRSKYAIWRFPKVMGVPKKNHSADHFLFVKTRVTTGDPPCLEKPASITNYIFIIYIY